MYPKIRCGEQAPKIIAGHGEAGPTMIPSATLLIALPMGAPAQPARAATPMAQSADEGWSQAVVVQGPLGSGPIGVTTLKGSSVTALRYIDVGNDCRPTGARLGIRTPAFRGVVSMAV